MLAEGFPAQVRNWTPRSDFTRRPIEMMESKLPSWPRLTVQRQSFDDFHRVGSFRKPIPRIVVRSFPLRGVHMETDGQSLDSLGYEVVVAAFVPVHHDAQVFRVCG